MIRKMRLSVGSTAALFLSMTMVFGVLSGCDRSTAPSGDAVKGAEANAASGDSAFDAYLKFKRIAVGDDANKAREKEKYLERKGLADAIEQQGSMDKSLLAAEMEDFRQNMLIGRYFESFLKQRVSDSAIQNYFANNPERYQKSKAKAAHILVRTEKNMPAVEYQQKRTRIQEAYSALVGGESFESVAARLSEDKTSSKRGGELGWIDENAIDKQFSTALLALKPGEYSQPVETVFGFHIIKLIDGPRVVKKPFSAVKGDIRYQLRAEAKAAELDRLLGRTTSNAAAGSNVAPAPES